MAEIMLSKGQIENAVGTLETAVDTALSPVDKETVYKVATERLPRPSFDTFAARALAGNVAGTYGKGFKLMPSQAQLLAGFNNLRIIASVQTRDKRSVYLPGVVLPTVNGNVMLGCLSRDAMTDGHALNRPLSSMQQPLLDNLYQMQAADPSHGGNAPVNAGEISHASLIASSTQPYGIHSKVHELADSRTFATSFSNQGGQDIRQGDKVRDVRNKVFAARQAANVYVFPEHQLSADELPFGLKLTAGELAVGMVLAASGSRGERPPLVENVTAIAEQAA